ncbi:hypothetical protein WJU16_05340 [Chitinophaga pollutisoli]|uniref:Uncharacterized protein n=1 Tax=Chitinophaga pollutisoli TaxID=3133966 RepID=A0ABZ2YRQ0_9BACT
MERRETTVGRTSRKELRHISDRYVLDLARDGYWATVHVVNGGKPAFIRNYIRSKRPVGAVMAGAIPVAWFEMSEDFNGAAARG